MPHSEDINIAIRQLLAGAGNIRSFDEVSVGLEILGWSIHPVRYNATIVGAILEKDGEIHTSIAPDFQKRWNPRPYIKNILYPALDKYGVLYSDAKKDDLNAQRWLIKLGYEHVREDNENIYFALKRKKFK